MEKSSRSIKYLILIGLVIIAGCFYWFQLRPSAIRKECNEQAILIERDHTVVSTLGREEIDRGKPWFSITKGFEYQTVYDQCLKNKGIE